MLCPAVFHVVFDSQYMKQMTYVYCLFCMYGQGLKQSTVMYVCVFSSHSFWTSSSLDVQAGVTQDFSSSHIVKSTDQPGKVTNPARGQLNTKNKYLPVPVSA